MIRLILADDHEIFIRGLAMLLADEPGFEVLATVNSATAVLEAIQQHDFDLLVLDVQMPDMKAEDLLVRVRELKPGSRIIYLTMMRGTRFLHRLLKSDIQGYMLKSAPVEELVKAINVVHAGGVYYSSEVDVSETEETVKQTITIPGNRVGEILSKREIEVLKLICLEYSNPEIAEKLFLSINTVDTHRRNILMKLGVNNTVGLVKFALQHGIIDAH
ncbi:MAG: response regulator transcription factor [Dinghuibacter sp.]|nr:response regulator transcription factor [Dinghuibacter sp.]